jgi:hypothetical protein
MTKIFTCNLLRDPDGKSRTVRHRPPKRKPAKGSVGVGFREVLQILGKLEANAQRSTPNAQRSKAEVRGGCFVSPLRVPIEEAQIADRVRNPRSIPFPLNVES